MLHAAEFPHAGSSAMFRGIAVRIHQWNNDGTALVFGDRATHRATRDELAPLPEMSRFDRWCAERITTVLGPAARTPATDVYADHLAWLRAVGAHESEFPTSEYAFRRQLLAAGYRMTRDVFRKPGDTHARLRILFLIALRFDGSGCA